MQIKQHQLLLFLKNKQFTMIAIKHKAEHENRKQDTAVNDGKCCSGWWVIHCEYTLEVGAAEPEDSLNILLSSLRLNSQDHATEVSVHKPRQEL